MEEQRGVDPVIRERMGHLIAMVNAEELVPEETVSDVSVICFTPTLPLFESLLTNRDTVA